MMVRIPKEALADNYSIRSTHNWCHQGAALLLPAHATLVLLPDNCVLCLVVGHICPRHISRDIRPIAVILV